MYQADKATILADAAKYVKRLEEQLKVLEDQQVPNTANFAPRSQKSKEGSQNCAKGDCIPLIRCLLTSLMTPWSQQESNHVRSSSKDFSPDKYNSHML